MAFSHDSAQLALASNDKTVKIWDASSGACLETHNIGKALFDLSFNSIGFALYTETITIVIRSSEVSSIRDVVEPESPLCVGTSLSLDSIWIKHAGDNMLWIPLEY